MKLWRRQQGFTLIEIMIAVAILAIISLLLWQSSAVMMNAKSRYELEDSRFHEVFMALSRMADDLSMAFLYQSVDHLGGYKNTEAQREIRFVASESNSQKSLNFATFSHIRYLKNSHESEQAEVGYFLRASEETGTMNLIKRVQAPPDRNAEEGGVEYVLLEGIKDIKYQFYDMNRKEWRPAWDSASLDYGKKLPRAVEITITIDDPVVEDETRSFVTTALVEMAPGPNDF